MKIAVLGTRGFPQVQGGVEAHCEKLYPRLVKLGCEITAFTRRPYIDPGLEEFQGVKLTPLNCPKSKSWEALIHTFKGIIAARRIRPDILHIHTIGPSLLVPLARVFGIKTVMTNHGHDYERRKWGLIGKAALRLGEYLGSKWANAIICISPAIAADIERMYKRRPEVIGNGIEIPETLKSEETLKRFGLEKGKYILAVGRLVPEKGFADLIAAFEKSALPGWKLVIVGAADHESRYSRDLNTRAKSNPDIVLTGFLKGFYLEELYSHAGFFVLPSYHEGLAIVLLEALSYKLKCLASDIPANRTFSLNKDNYFPAGDIHGLCAKLKEFTSKPWTEEDKARQIEVLRREYDWDTIARDTLEVYQKVRTKKT